MTVNGTKNGTCYVIELEGRLDSTTAPLLDQKLAENLDGVTELIFDIEELSYISSAGLRVLLTAQKRMNKQGSMKLINVCKEVKDIFNITGFADILTII